MESTLYIPNTLKVGYQERNDTYTKKLAYVIYIDEKGVLRKEMSWNGWKNENIPVDTFENIPTEGFVLNKGVGGVRHSYGWNARNEYIRVYDPRNFEFEISVANLLFILEVTSSIKGKGLEGEFVYSWEGKELVLLPVDCDVYRISCEYTKYKDYKVKKKDLKVGYLYKTKYLNELVYLGDLLHFNENYNEYTLEKMQVYYDTNSHKFLGYKNQYHLAIQLSENVVDSYNGIMEEYYHNSPHSNIKQLSYDDVTPFNEIEDIRTCMVLYEGIVQKAHIQFNLKYYDWHKKNHTYIGARVNIYGTYEHKYNTVNFYGCHKILDFNDIDELNKNMCMVKQYIEFENNYKLELT